MNSAIDLDSIVPLNFVCPDCGQEHRQISSQFLGKRIKCTCGKVLRLGSRSDASSNSNAVGDSKENTESPGNSPPPAHIENRDPVFGNTRRDEGYHPEYSLYNPVTPQEVKTYFRTSIRPNFQTPSPVINPAIDPQVSYHLSVSPVARSSHQSGRGILNLVAGLLGLLQSLVVGIFLIVQLMQLLSMWTAFGQGVEGLQPSQIDAIKNQLLVATLILTVLLLMKIGFATFSGMLLAGGLQELSPGGNPRPDLATNAAVVAIVYNVLLVLVGILILVTFHGTKSLNSEHFSIDRAFGSMVIVFLKVGLLAIVPTFQIIVGANRSGEPNAR